MTHPSSTFILPQVWFGFINGWSGQAVYDELILTLFSVSYTALPPLFYGIFEKDISEKTIYK